MRPTPPIVALVETPWRAHSHFRRQRGGELARNCGSEDHGVRGSIANLRTISIRSARPWRMRQGCRQPVVPWRSPSPVTPRTTRADPQLAGKRLSPRLPWDRRPGRPTRVPAQPSACDELGTIAPGKRRRLVLWTGDPLEVSSVAAQVWLDGRAIRCVHADRTARPYLRTQGTREAGGLPRAIRRASIRNIRISLHPSFRRKPDNEAQSVRRRPEGLPVAVRDDPH